MSGTIFAIGLAFGSVEPNNNIVVLVCEDGNKNGLIQTRKRGWVNCSPTASTEKKLFERIIENNSI